MLFIPKLCQRKANYLLKASSCASLPITKLPHEGDPHITDYDRDISNYTMNQIYACNTQPEEFIYEVMENSKKLLLDVHGIKIPYTICTQRV